MNISSLDRNLLIELSKNCRTPVKQLASKFKKPRSTISYHLNNLQNKGILKSFNAIIDQQKLGTIYARVELKFSHIDNEKLDSFKKFLDSNAYVHYYSHLQGNVDFAIALYIYTISQLYKTINSIKNELSGSIEKLDFSLGYKVHYCFPKVFFKEEIPSFAVTYDLSESSLDKQEYALLSLLQKNATTSIVKLSGLLNLDTRTIINKKNKLEKSIILKYLIDIDFTKIGFCSHHVLWRFYKHDQKRINQFKQMLLCHPNVRYVTEVIGDNSSLDCEFLIKKESSLHPLLHEIREKYSDIIRNSDSFMMIHTPHHF